MQPPPKSDRKRPQPPRPTRKHAPISLVSQSSHAPIALVQRETILPLRRTTPGWWRKWRVLTKHVLMVQGMCFICRTPSQPYIPAKIPVQRPPTAFRKPLLPRPLWSPGQASGSLRDRVPPLCHDQVSPSLPEWPSSQIRWPLCCRRACVRVLVRTLTTPDRKGSLRFFLPHAQRWSPVGYRHRRPELVTLPVQAMHAWEEVRCSMWRPAVPLGGARCPWPAVGSRDAGAAGPEPGGPCGTGVADAPEADHPRTADRTQTRKQVPSPAVPATRITRTFAQLRANALTKGLIRLSDSMLRMSDSTLLFEVNKNTSFHNNHIMTNFHK